MKKKEHFRVEYEVHIGKIVLSDSYSCCVYLGTYEDEEDVYYKCMGISGDIVYHTCVGGIIPLFGRISDEDYNGIKTSFKHNLTFYVQCVDNGMLNDDISKETKDNNIKKYEEIRVVISECLQ